MCDFEIEDNYLKQYNISTVCGVDEVGRGALFGPVVAAAVILNPLKLDRRIKDSKKLSPKKRIQIAESVYQSSLAYSLYWISNDEIDQINILNATKKAMKMAVNGLQILPDYVLMDGMEPDFLTIPGEGIVKGDSKSISIAAASIIAKVFRDQYIESLSPHFPGFELNKNKGYPTKKHINMVTSTGRTIFHRQSFRLKHGEG